MHIPDGYLGPATYGGAWAVMVPIWGYASRRVKATVMSHQVPYLAMGTVFSLLAMMFMFPIPGGTTGHINGAAVVAILLGPWAAVVAVSVSLFIQGLVFGDGGITAVAANCINIAVVGGLAGWGIHAAVLRGGTIFRSGPPGPPGKAPDPPLALRLGAGAAASYLAVNLGALLAAVELGIQPLLHSGAQGGAAYFPYPLKVAIPAVMLPHLTTVGALEAGVTVLVLGFFHKAEVNFGDRAKAVLPVALCLLALSGASVASAHDYWIERKGSGFAVVYGHGDQRMEYDPANVKNVTVLDAAGRPVAGAEVEGDHEKVASTDRDGIAKVPLEKGRNLFTVVHREPLAGDPDADSVSVTTTLTFEVAR